MGWRKKVGRIYYVYILRSRVQEQQTYVGCTQDLRKRMTEHNSGKSIHTNKFKPWELSVYVAFQQKDGAEQFERYLKSGSGRTFMKRHF
ncbi:MAG: GIY-YIG nuclease family protein, partial [Candidatus Acidiferrales bacterium]